MQREHPTTLFAGRVALVTGASRGIGRAIAIALAQNGASVYLIGRDPIALSEAETMACQFSTASNIRADLTVDADIERLRRRLEAEIDKLDILIHSAGCIYQHTLEGASIDNLDAQYATNVRAPYAVTKELLPLLKNAAGQIIFINSSAGLSAKRADLGQYSATKHALKAIADSLREEVNPDGIRVITLYLGRTATPMQQALYQQQGKSYDPQRLLQPEDVASVVVQALAIPPTAEITDISIRPMQKSY
ncbi:MAG TPA: SDR family NAD(P)-dependent oxidoreductase [Terriglobales bacterium]|nr:SDR family NAD(P)-dependent oxidoreductase [Terriglobales bacterium]